GFGDRLPSGGGARPEHPGDPAGEPVGGPYDDRRHGPPARGGCLLRAATTVCARAAGTVSAGALGHGRMVVVTKSAHRSCWKLLSSGEYWARMTRAPHVEKEAGSCSHSRDRRRFSTGSAAPA